MSNVDQIFDALETTLLPGYKVGFSHGHREGLVEAQEMYERNKQVLARQVFQLVMEGYDHRTESILGLYLKSVEPELKRLAGL